MQDQILHTKFHTMLDRAERVLLVAHKKPDGDTLGSASAILNYLLSRGKAVTAFCADTIPEAYQYLPNVDRFTHDQAVWREHHDLLCVFDAGDLRYAGVADLVPLLPSKPIIVNLDHHATNELFGDLNVLLIDASSTAEVVYRGFVSVGRLIDPHVATCLLTGIITDTSNFINPATNAMCVQAASHLLNCGARMGIITSSLLRNKTVPALRLWGRALERITENQDLGIASTIIREDDFIECENASEAVEGIANFLGAVLDIPVIMVLRELPDGLIKGSLRSTKKDVAAIAKLLGGGGHKKAAGFTVLGTLVEKEGIWQVQPSSTT